jgi:hypothetical protein
VSLAKKGYRIEILCKGDFEEIGTIYQLQFDAGRISSERSRLDELRLKLRAIAEV